MMMRADTNGDGKISRDEFTAMSDQRFARLDKNGDGFITADEASDMQGRGPGGGVMAADADHDGKVSHAEFTATGDGALHQARCEWRRADHAGRDERGP